MPKTTKELAIKSVMESKFEHEAGLIRSGKLQYTNHNDSYVYFQSTIINQTTGMDAMKAKFWYRSMSRADYIRLKNKIQLNLGNSYCGIATNFNYLKHYFNNGSDGSHIVEFQGVHQLLLGKELMQLNPPKGSPQGPKGEGDGGTFGLGPTGFLKGAGGKRFNELLDQTQITFRLVACKLPLIKS